MPTVQPTPAHPPRPAFRTPPPALRVDGADASRPAAAKKAPARPDEQAPRQDAFVPDALQVGSASELVGTIVNLPATAVLFVAETSLMLTRLLGYQLLHPFNMDVARVMNWVRKGAQGEPPTTDPDMLALLIRTQNAAFAELMTGHLEARPGCKADVVAVMRWAIATQGKGKPPTNDPRILASLVAMQVPDFAKLMTGYLDKHPRSGPDVAATLQWAIRTRGKSGSPAVGDPHLLVALIRSQNAAFADAMASHLRAYPRSGPEAIKVMRWAIETHGKGVPPTNDAHLLATLIRTQRADFAELMAKVLREHPEAAADVAEVERWAIRTGGKGMPPSFDPFVLAALISTAEPAFAKLTGDYAAAHPSARQDVVAIQRWAIETRGEGVPPTHDAELLATLIASREPAFGRRLLAFRAANPDLDAETAKVARWAIQTQGTGRPPTDEPRLLGCLIGHADEKVAAALLGHLGRVPGSGVEVAKVMHWAIATKGEGRPPTEDPRLLATLIGHVEPGLGRKLDHYAARHPRQAAEVARVAHWVIATKGQKLEWPPTRKPGLLWLLVKVAIGRKLAG